MRPVRREVPGFGPHTIIDVLLIAFGITLLVGIVSLPEISFFHGLVLAIAGALMVAVPFGMVRRLGFLALLLGTYIVCRHVGFVSTEYLRYGLACFLLLIGSIGVARDTLSTPRAIDLEPEDSL